MSASAMSEGLGAYIAQVEALADLGDGLRRDLAQVESESASAISGALLEERATRDQLAAVERRLARLEREIATLVTNAAVAEPTGSDPVLFAELRDVEGFLRALTGDTESARSAWAWVERARAAQSEPPPATPAPQSNDPVDGAVKPATRARPNVKWISVLAGVGLVVLVLLLVLWKVF